jgi:hypothetical protein
MDSRLIGTLPKTQRIHFRPSSYVHIVVYVRKVGRNKKPKGGNNETSELITNIDACV